ncbi:helix-turn-helix transcriptional regulator [Kineococcus rubinsiae]|uniref:helix-turn-helix transcriptional regulator n=1 Tax=Kineococcus rubinsiae TaxID=2609562 RepID=UPI00142F4EBD|nr:helix-turn-helix transcriptional regulator [Kineococcus rubinsiae]NIZ89673.1 helix-turn-helix domain-containing protein [Kineococcus rubinsiae]
MDNRAEVRDFLVTRRAKVSAAQAGLPEGGPRRVPGLRRAEVASLAGVSVEYYAKLERGALGGVSASVLEGLARALQLDEAERAHLFALAQAAEGTSALARPRRRPTASWVPRPSLQWTLDAITAPAIVVNGRMDLLAANGLGRAMHSSVYESPHAAPAGGPPNFARYTFLDRDGRRFYPHWDTAAAICVAILRTTAGRDPADKEMHDLVGELSTRSEEFRRLWASHDVRHHGTGTKTFHHTAVGDLELAYESTDVVAEPGLVLTVYTAEPASPTAERLGLLASWAATELAATPPDGPLALDGTLTRSSRATPTAHPDR